MSISQDQPGSPRLQRLRTYADLQPSEYEDGRECWCRPGQLLVPRGDITAVEAQLRERGFGIQRYDDLDDLGVRCCTLADEATATDAARQLRSVDRGAAPQVAPNYVLMGEPVYHGGPGSDPRPAAALEGDPPGPPNGVRVGVLDTGIVEHDWLEGRYHAEPGGQDELDADSNGVLDDQAGHGTFVAGVILQQAPGATVHVAKVLDSHGIGDDVSVARGVRQLARDGCQVLNLSLGGYTDDNQAPPLLRRALDELGGDVVVVAAAGNNGSTRVFWPAALPGVVAVGALEPEDHTPAWFTNRGAWVDACAGGVDRLSTFVTHDGPREPLTLDGPDQDDFRGYAYWSGTSFAAPLVAGRIAALMTAHGISAPAAAQRLLNDPAAPRVPDLGVVVG